ncbi:MAG: hypothetical protein Kow0063_41400 [Anaerolineae bacterium]
MSKRIIGWLSVSVLALAVGVLLTLAQGKELLVQSPIPMPESPAALTWEPLDLPPARVDLLDDKRVQALAIDPQTPTTLYAGTTQHGVYKTIDGAATWLDTGLPVTNTTALAVDPQDPETVYVGSGGGLFKSTDGGQTWNRAGTRLEETAIWSLAIDPQQPQTLYAGVWEKGLWRSADAGQNWIQMSAALTSSQRLTGTHVMAIVVDPQDSQHLYAGVVDDLQASEGRVVQSRDGGETWEDIASQPTRAIAIAPPNPEQVYAGFFDGALWRSDDGGRNWQEVSTDLDDCVALLVDPSNPETLYAGTNSGIYTSTDAGESWDETDQDTGIFLALVADPSMPGMVYGGTSGQPGEQLPAPPPGGVFKSTDGGASWFPANKGAELSDRPVEVFALSSDPNRPTVLLLGTDEGVYHSSNGGETWLPAGVGGLLFKTQALVLNPHSGGRMWYAAGPGGVFRSDNGGEALDGGQRGVGGPDCIRAGHRP